MGLFFHANSLKWNAFFGWNNLFFHAKNMVLQERKYFPLKKTWPEERKWNQKALFLWISYREMKMLSTLQSHCHRSSQPREAKISGSLDSLCQPKPIRVNFIPVKFPRSFQVESRKRKFIILLLKQSLFFLEFPVNEGEKATFLSFWPSLEGRNLSKLYTLLKEWMWFSQLFYWIHWIFVQHPVGILEQHTGNALWWEGALCLVQVELWVSSGPGHRGHRVVNDSGWRRLPTRALISSGTSQSVLH